MFQRLLDMLSPSYDRMHNISDSSLFLDERELDLCLTRLKFLSSFYMRLIENRQYEMNEAHLQFLNNRDNITAYETWTHNRIKILHLYEYWLRELKEMDVVDDPQAVCMYYMMISDCYYFLAKLNRPAFERTVSNYDKACQALVTILDALTPLIPCSNSFYQHVLMKLRTVLKDYKTALGSRRSSLFMTIPRVPMNMFEADWNHLRDYIDIYRRYSGNEHTKLKHMELKVPSTFALKLNALTTKVNKLFA